MGKKWVLSLLFTPLLSPAIGVEKGRVLVGECLNWEEERSCLQLEKVGNFLQKKCARGDLNSCQLLQKLREMYRRGMEERWERWEMGSFQVAEKREKELEEECIEGGGGECRRLGEKYEWGEGVPKNPGLAYRFYQRGCKYGDGRSCYFLGEVWEGKKALIRCPSNLKLALKFYRRGCKLGDIPSCKKVETLSPLPPEKFPFSKKEGSKLP